MITMNTRNLLKLAAGLSVSLFVGGPFASAQFVPSDVAQPTPVRSSDEAARDAIRTAFDMDPRVPSRQVAIVVTADTVTLFGTVPDEETRDAALRLARAAVRERSVHARLKIGDAALETARTENTDDDRLSVEVAPAPTGRTGGELALSKREPSR